jgi:hypothetical protein
MRRHAAQLPLPGRPSGRSGIVGLSRVAGLTCIAGVSGCDSNPEATARFRTLEAERTALTAYLAATEPAPGGEQADATPVVPFADVLVLLRQALIVDLIQAALPFETELSQRYRVRVETAEVRLRPGIALVDLGGRASLINDPGVFADITLVGTFEIAPKARLRNDRMTAPRAGIGAALAARVRIFGVQTGNVELGRLAPPAERLVDGLARLRLTELNRVLGEVPIPIYLDEVIELPLVEETEVTIPPASLALTFELEAVRVLETGVFVSLSVARDADRDATALGGITVDGR